MTTSEVIDAHTGWPEARALWRLDPSVAHLNHGSFGAVPVAVAEAQRSFQDRMHANPVRFFKSELRQGVAVAREYGAAFVGADPAGFALVPNATTGVNTVLASFPLEHGDEILLTDHGYGAVAYTVDRACAGTGAKPVTVALPLDADADLIVDALLAAITPRTRLAVIDHITSPTARRFPVEQLVPALQERGVAVLVDAAHAPGMVPLNLTALAPDFWTGNFHKWACAATGTAGLYVAPRWRDTVRPLVVSWFESFGYPEAFDHSGTADLTNWMALPTALDLLGDLGWDALRRYNSDLAARGQALVAGALGVDPAQLIGDDGVSMRLVELPPGVAPDEEAATALWARISDELGVEVAVNGWNGRGLLRVSAQGYNALPDYQRLAEGLPLDW